MICNTEPVSRLTLEMFYLGELHPQKQIVIRGHIASCDACREALSYIEQDRRPLPSLRVSKAVRRPSWFKRAAVAWIPAAAAVAVALVFALKPPVKEKSETSSDMGRNIKGGDTSLYIVRNRAGAVDENPTAFQDGDKFKIFVTHLGNAPTGWDLAVFQGDEVFFPLTPDAPLMPGARVPLNGALTLDGKDPAVLCIFIGENLPDRSRIRAKKQAMVPQAAACRTLRTGAFEQYP